MEQTALNSLIDFRTPLLIGAKGKYYIHPDLENVIQTKASIFRCPSDGSDHLYNIGQVGSTSGPDAFARGTNYMFCTGSGVYPNFDVRYPTDGIFFYKSQCQIACIQDGTSNTVILSETKMGDNASSPSESDAPEMRRAATLSSVISVISAASNQPGSTPALTDPGDGSFANLRTLTSACTTWNSARAGAWIWGAPLYSSFNGYYPPNHDIPDIHFHGVGFYGARSNHPAGINGGLADGSVRFFSNQTSPELWRALTTVAGGETNTNH